MSSSHPAFEPGDEPALPALVKSIVDDLGTLVAGHIKLARAELEVCTRRYGQDLALYAVAGALAFLGWALLCVAAALGLTRALGAPLAFAVVGGAQLVVSFGALRALARRAAPAPLVDTFSELGRTADLLSMSASPARPRKLEPRGAR